MNFWNLLGMALLLVLAAAGVSRFIRRITVYEYQHALKFVRGTFSGILPPGSYWILSPITSVEFIEARPQIITIPGQEVLSSDGVSLKVSMLLEIRISDPRAATLDSASYQDSLYASAQTALRLAIGEKPIDEVLASRADLAARLQAEIAPAASALGIDLKSISVKDIMFPGSLKEAFSQTARAKQEAQATLERARGETAALRNMANAAHVFDNNPNLFQLRLLQAASESGKIVLNVAPPTPVPEDDATGSAP